MRQTTFVFASAKACRVCGETKPVDDFYRAPENRDGRSNRCKACQAVYYQGYQQSHRKGIAETQASWYDQNRERIIERQREYYRSNRDSVQSRIKRWRAANPEKEQARVQVRVAMEAGEIGKQPCSQCGEEKAEAHHGDYTKPLDVRWLCRRCHRRHHASLAS
jgi:ribosomal protein S27AE